MLETEYCCSLAPRFELKQRTLILFAICWFALIFAGFAMLPLLMRKSHNSRVWPEHAFALGEPPGSLTEEFAIAKAFETLPLDGFDPKLWLVASNGCIFSSNHALVNIYTHGVADACYVRVELKGNQLICQVAEGGPRE